MASRRARRGSRDVEQHVERVVRRLQLRVYQAVSSRSPVDTGFFRSRWTPSRAAPDRSGPTTRPRDPQTARSLAQRLLSENQRRADEVAARWRLADGLAFIVNNTRYGVFLNDGSSAQAPAMFVQMGIADGIRATRAELR